jgi:hypothetical protein
MELMSNLSTRDAFTPRGMMKLSFTLLQVCAEALKLMLPGEDNYATWQEFQNKLRSFDLFENVDSTLQLRSPSSLPLTSMVARSLTLGPYRGVWATEGIGHYYAERCLSERGTVRGLLQSDGAEALPTGSLTALHAGMGLSFAGRILGGIGRNCSSCTVREALEEFVALCAGNSHEGYEGATYEALGLTARNLHPHLVSHIDRELELMDKELVGYFWHGVGRALYFAPSNFLPINSAPWQAVNMAHGEPPHELGRRNALAGLVWSLVLINIRHPQILELFVRHHGQRFDESDAFTNGLISALVIWRDSSPNDPFIEKLFSYRPVNSTVAELWDRYVASCSDALPRYHRIFKQGKGLGRLFRYQSLPELCVDLENRRSIRNGSLLLQTT